MNLDAFNTDYYEKYNNNIPESNEVPETIKLNIKKWVLRTPYWKYELIKTNKEKIDKKTLDQLQDDWLKTTDNFEGKKYKLVPKILKLVFYNKKLYSWNTIKLVYFPYNNNIRVYWIIQQWEFIKYDRPKNYNVNVKEKIFSQIWNILWCKKSCWVKKENWKYTFYEIDHKVKRRHFKFLWMKWEINIDKWTKYIKKWEILFNWNSWIVLKNWKVILQIEKFPWIYLLKDRKWNIVKQISNTKNIYIKIPQLDETIWLQISN